MVDRRFEDLPPHQQAVVSDWATADRAKRVILAQQDTIITLRAELADKDKQLDKLAEENDLLRHNLAAVKQGQACRVKRSV